MRTRQLERRKKLIAWTCSSVGWISTVVYWMDGLHSNSLPGQLPGGYPVDLAGLLLLMVAVVGVVAALPDEEDPWGEGEEGSGGTGWRRSRVAGRGRQSSR